MVKRYNQFILENINPEISIENVRESDIPEILEMCVEAFNFHTPNDVKETITHLTNFKISKKAIINNKIVGCYLFNREPIDKYLQSNNNVISNKKYSLLEDTKKYKYLKGIRGIALVVLPEYKNKGIGKKLREIPLKMGYDYVWGCHSGKLENEENWKKFGRRVVARNKDNDSVTIMDLNNKPKKLNLLKNKISSIIPNY